MTLALASSTVSVSNYLGSSPETVTSNSFNPPSGSVIIVTAVSSDSYHDDWATGFPTITDSLSTHLTWTAVQPAAFSNALTTTSARVAVWWAYTPTAPGAMTVNVTEEASGGQHVYEMATIVDVWTGSQSSPIGAVASNGNVASTGTLNVNLIPEADGSAVMLACAVDAANVITAASNSFTHQSGSVGTADFASVWIGNSSGPALTTSTSQETVGVTATASTWQYIAYEILAAAATSTSYTFTATATDTVTGQTGTGNATFTVTGGAGSPVVNTLTMPVGIVSTPYTTTTLTASGGVPPYTWSIVSGALPAGLSMTSGGVVSGTPTTAETSNFTVEVTDSASHTGTLALSVTVNAATSNPIPEPQNPFFAVTGSGGEQIGEFFFYLNNSGSGSMTLWVEDPGTVPFTFGAVATETGTAVQGYPACQLNGSWEISSFTSILASWAEGGPAAGPGIDYEAAFDLWGSGFVKEMMIWTRNVGQTPAGSQVATVTINGVTYQVWSGNSGNTLSYVAETPFSSATNFNVLAFFNDSVSRGFHSASDTIVQMDFGWEVCGTNGQAMNFSCSGYNLVVTT